MTEQATLQPSEAIMFSLRSLYDRYGYSIYKMNKFEEYDLYAHNKDFLISDGVITFTDTNGKLMALKPDVTLSIVKNTKDTVDTVQKLYYNENVYRVSKGSRTFKEIMQVGLECLGNVDDYCIYEVLKLALESLRTIKANSILDISHLGLLSEVMDNIGIPPENQAELMHFIGEKNRHDLADACRALGVSEDKVSLLKQLVAIHGEAGEVLPSFEKLLSGMVSSQTLARFSNTVSALNSGDTKGMLHIDFSVVDDMHYYNGFVFKGFVEGIPSGILSGGQYDTLMKKMNRKSGAIGFAVYLDMLEQLGSLADKYDVDTLLIYDSSSSAAKIGEAAQAIMQSGKSVMVQSSVPSDIKYRKLMKIQNGEVITLENRA